MAKPMSKDKTIEALREANAALTADVASLSEAVGDLEIEIVEAHAATLAARLLAAGEAADELRETIAAQAREIARHVDHGAQAADEMEKLREALRWAEAGRKEDDEAANALLAEARGEVEAKDEEIGRLEAKIEEMEREEGERQSEEADEILAALRDYLVDLGYPSDAHPSSIPCPNLRRLVEAAL